MAWSRLSQHNMFTRLDYTIRTLIVSLWSNGRSSASVQRRRPNTHTPEASRSRSSHDSHSHSSLGEKGQARVGEAAARQQRTRPENGARLYQPEDAVFHQKDDTQITSLVLWESSEVYDVWTVAGGINLMSTTAIGQSVNKHRLEYECERRLSSSHSLFDLT